MARSDGFRRRETPTPMAEDPLAGLDDARKGAIERINATNRAYAELVCRMQALDMDFAVDVTACETLQEALSVCSAWMTRRTDALVATQQKFMLDWLSMSETRFRARAMSPRTWKERQAGDE